MKKILTAMMILAPAAAGAQVNTVVSTAPAVSAPAAPAAAVPAAAAPRQPGKLELMGKLDIFGGQYFFENQAGAFNGYGVLDLQLAKSYSASSGFYVSAKSVYTGFKQVNELSGGGTLFQQSLDNSIGAKWIRRYEGGFSLKPRVGVKSQLFRETKDEKWGEGLYDLTRYEAGLTLERKTRWGLSTPWIYQLSWDAYYTRYARFKSLASEYGGGELNPPDPGSRVLDTLTNQFSYDSEFDLPGFLKADLFFALSMVGYQDQKVINSEGRYLQSERSDSYQTLSLSLSKRYNDINALGQVRPVLGMSLGLANLISNQNHLDTDLAHLKFIRSFYDYSEARLSPSAQFTFIDTGLILRLNYEFALRSYSDRLAQESDGSYTPQKLSQYSNSFNVETVYPVYRSIDLKLQCNWAASRSNNRYERTYRYNYNSSMYFAGMEWRF